MQDLSFPAGKSARLFPRRSEDIREYSGITLREISGYAPESTGRTGNPALGKEVTRFHAVGDQAWQTITEKALTYVQYRGDQEYWQYSDSRMNSALCQRLQHRLQGNFSCTF